MDKINKVQDLTLRYKVKTYNKIQKVFDLSDNEFNNLQFMLALLGFNSKRKVPLESKTNEDSRSFSIRTTYFKKASEFDVNYGLISILDNLEKNYSEVVNHIAFEKTFIHNRPFFKMENVETFYQYMLSGLDFYEVEFLKYGNKTSDIVDAINEFLEKDIDLEQNNIDELLIDNTNYGH